MLRFAVERFAVLRFVLERFELERFAPLRFPLERFAVERFAVERLLLRRFDEPELDVAAGIAGVDASGASSSSPEPASDEVRYDCSSLGDS